MGLGEGLRVDAKPTGKVCLIEAGGNRVTIEKYSFLLDVGFDGKQELREEFAKDQLLLTVALGAAPATARIGYNVAEIAKCVAPSFVFFFFVFLSHFLLVRFAMFGAGRKTATTTTPFSVHLFLLRFV